jgi:hypothetical protein
MNLVRARGKYFPLHFDPSLPAASFLPEPEGFPAGFDVFLKSRLSFSRQNSLVLTDTICS